MTATKSFARVSREIKRWAGVVRTDAPDRDLLGCFVQNQDEAAFAQLVQRHGPMVLGVCRKLVRHAHDAEDAFQATFLVLARKASAIRKQESVGGWLYGVAYRVANKLRHKQARQRQHETRVPECGYLSEPTPNRDEPSWREVQAAVLAELDRLDDKYRAPLVLCYVEGKTRDEAAQQLGWGLGVLRGRLERGREALRARLMRRGLTLASALITLGVVEAAHAALVPPALFNAAIAAAVCATRLTMSGAVSAQVAALSGGVIRAMFLSKLKTAVVALVVTLGIGAGVSVVSFQALTAAEPPAAEPPAAEPPAVQPAQQPAAKQPGAHAATQATKEDYELAKLRAEIERLRAELDETKRALKKSQITIQELKANQDELLKVAPKGPDGKEMDRAALMRWLMLSQIGRKSEVGPMANSPDGRWTATANNQTVRVFDAQTGKILSQIVAHKAAVTSLAFSPDAKVLASAGMDKAIFFFDAASGQIVRKLEVAVVPMQIQFSADGKTLTVTESDRTRREIDAETGKEIRVIKEKTGN